MTPTGSPPAQFEPARACPDCHRETWGPPAVRLLFFPPGDIWFINRPLRETWHPVLHLASLFSSPHLPWNTRWTPLRLSTSPVFSAGRPLLCGVVDAKMPGIAPQITSNLYGLPHWFRGSHADPSAPPGLAQTPRGMRGCPYSHPHHSAGRQMSNGHRVRLAVWTRRW